MSKKRNTVHFVAEAMACGATIQAAESTINHVTDEEETTTVNHFGSIAVGSVVYYAFLNRPLHSTIDRVADWRIARKERKAAKKQES